MVLQLLKQAGWAVQENAERALAGGTADDVAPDEAMRDGELRLDNYGVLTAQVPDDSALDYYLDSVAIVLVGRLGYQVSLDFDAVLAISVTVTAANDVPEGVLVVRLTYHVKICVADLSGGSDGDGDRVLQLCAGLLPLASEPLHVSVLQLSAFGEASSAVTTWVESQTG